MSSNSKLLISIMQVPIITKPYLIMLRVVNWFFLEIIIWWLLLFLKLEVKSFFQRDPLDITRLIDDKLVHTYFFTQQNDFIAFYK